MKSKINIKNTASYNDIIIKRYNTNGKTTYTAFYKTILGNVKKLCSCSGELECLAGAIRSKPNHGDIYYDYE